jgi:hypothetical protein
MTSFRPFCVSKLIVDEDEDDEEVVGAGVDEKCTSRMCSNSASAVEKRVELA